MIAISAMTQINSATLSRKKKRNGSFGAAAGSYCWQQIAPVLTLQRLLKHQCSRRVLQMGLKHCACHDIHFEYQYVGAILYIVRVGLCTHIGGAPNRHPLESATRYQMYVNNCAQFRMTSPLGTTLYITEGTCPKNCNSFLISSPCRVASSKSCSGAAATPAAAAYQVLHPENDCDALSDGVADGSAAMLDGGAGGLYLRYAGGVQGKKHFLKKLNTPQSPEYMISIHIQQYGSHK